MYSEVCQKADLVKILPDPIVKELTKSANVDFERDTYAEILSLWHAIGRESCEDAETSAGAGLILCCMIAASV
jgi:hypothetical protein